MSPSANIFSLDERRPARRRPLHPRRRQFNVQDCAVLHGQRNLYPVIVGDWVTIGHNATVHGCVVEDAVLIGTWASRSSTTAASARAPSSPPRSSARAHGCRAQNAVGRRPAKLRRELGDKDRALILEYARTIWTMWRSTSMSRGADRTHYQMRSTP